MFFQWIFVVNLTNVLKYFKFIFQFIIIGRFWRLYFIHKGNRKYNYLTVLSERPHLDEVLEYRLHNREKEIHSSAGFIAACKSDWSIPHPYQVLYLNHRDFNNFPALKCYSGYKLGDHTINDLGIQYRPNGKIYTSNWILTKNGWIRRKSHVGKVKVSVVTNHYHIKIKNQEKEKIIIKNQNNSLNNFLVLICIRLFYLVWLIQ